MKLVFADAHAHSNPVNGLGAREIARRFRSVNGWFLALVSLSPWHYKIDAREGFEAYKKAFEIHLRECKELRNEGLRTACIAGFHPADVDKLRDMGLDASQVLELGLRVVNYAAELCRKGILDGIGEVGRQHYTTKPENVAIAIEILNEALRLSRDYDCIVHMHLENAGRVTVDLVERIVERIKCDRARLLFHHSKPSIAAYAVERGYYATIPGKEQILRYYFTTFRGKNEKLLIESDYIDDPRRPCVSSCPWQIVERQQRLLKEGVVDEETLYKINVDNIVSFYRVEPP